MTTCGWLWIYAGSALMLLELVVPGFVLCFFGLAAATVGALRLMLGEVRLREYGFALLLGIAQAFVREHVRALSRQRAGRAKQQRQHEAQAKAKLLHIQIPFRG